MIIQQYSFQKGLFSQRYDWQKINPSKGHWLEQGISLNVLKNSFSFFSSQVTGNELFLK